MLNRMTERKVSTVTYISNHKETDYILMGHPWYGVRDYILKLLRKKGSVIYKGVGMDKVKEYKWPDKETMYNLMECKEFETGRYVIEFSGKGWNLPDMSVEDFKNLTEEEFNKLFNPVEEEAKDTP